MFSLKWINKLTKYILHYKTYTFLRKNPENNICMAMIGDVKLIANAGLDAAIEIVWPVKF